jgi:uncharacterized RDD family membrane protein YckC/plasmid stabilization system protein ParE
MEAHSDDETRPSGVADAIGGAAVFSARVAARAWRGRLETAIEELLSTPEVGRVLDRALAGSLPEEATRSLVRHGVAERIVRELAASGELERMVDRALASPETLVLVDRVLASEAMAHVLERALAGPELRSAMAAQSAGLAEQVAGDVRDGATSVDRRLSTVRTPTEFAGVASRGIALVVDALAIVTISLAVGAAAGLVGSLVGGIRPHWLAGTLLGLAGVAIAVGYFTLFWQTAGQTPGMRLMHVRVLPARGDRRLTIWRALVRTLGLALAIVPCFLGFVPALFDRRRRALPDYLAGTVVVYDDGAREVIK